MNIWTIGKREYSLYFASPIAYMLLFVVLLVLGIFFYINLAWAVNNPSYGYVPGAEAITTPLAVLLVLIIPAITTRLLAEERRLGTIELLLTAPVRDWELVVGKWLGAFLLLATIIAVTLIYPMTLHQLVEPGIDQGKLVAGYLGLLLMAAALVAVGVFVSSLFSNQIAAFVTTMGVIIFLWWILGPIAQVAGPASGMADYLTYINFSGHFYDTLARGIIDLKDIAYYLSLTALGLFLASVSVEMRRWG